MTSTATVNRGRRHWTPKEDALLRRLVQTELDNKRPLLWRELAEHIPGRSNKDCRKRWWNSLAGGNTKGAWSAEEDRRLTDAVEKYGTNWPQVAAAVGSRCGDQCSSHWRQALNPDINYCDWTSDEDEKLLLAVQLHGTNWSTIASFHTPQRTTLALKNQYCKLRLRRGNEGRSSPSTSLRDRPRVSGQNQSLALDSGIGEESDDSEGYEDCQPVTGYDKPKTPGLDADYPDGSHPIGQDPFSPKTGPVNPIDPEASPVTCSYEYPTPAASSGPWKDDTGEPFSQGGSITSFYSPDSSTRTPGSLSGELLNLQYNGQDINIMDIDTGTWESHMDTDIFSQSNFYFSDTEPSLSFFPTADAPSAESGKEELELVVAPNEVKDKAPGIASHKVSINLSCNREQLGKVMSYLVNTGCVMSMEVDST